MFIYITLILHITLYEPDQQNKGLVELAASGATLFSRAWWPFCFYSIFL